MALQWTRDVAALRHSPASNWAAVLLPRSHHRASAACLRLPQVCTQSSNPSQAGRYARSTLTLAACTVTIDPHIRRVHCHDRRARPDGCRSSRPVPLSPRSRELSIENLIGRSTAGPALRSGSIREVRREAVYSTHST